MLRGETGDKLGRKGVASGVGAGLLVGLLAPLLTGRNQHRVGFAGGLLHHTYSFLGVETYRQVSTERIPAGDVRVKMLFEADESRPGTGASVTLWASDRQIGEGRIERTAPVAYSSYAGMDVSRDNGLVVDRAYEDRAPYAFTGR